MHVRFWGYMVKLFLIVTSNIRKRGCYQFETSPNSYLAIDTFFISVDWQPFFGQNYSEQEITLTTVLIQLISECLTLYIPLALDNLKNHEFLYYYTNKYTLLILTATPLMSQICSDI